MSCALSGEGSEMSSLFPVSSMTPNVTILPPSLTMGGRYPVALNISAIGVLLPVWLAPSNVGEARTGVTGRASAPAFCERAA